MCGISVILSKSGDLSRSILLRMNEAIAHRGPDGSGYEFFDQSCQRTDADLDWRIGLAHQRLTIIDLLDTGKQPMTYKDGLWITFNGEIYNYLELKKELVQLGYAFRSTSDTEVILAAYHQWGTASFSKFRGMWGLAILDTKRGALIVCRDRMGIKPLYFFQHEKYVAFVSEIKQVLTLPGFIPRPDKAVVKQYLLTGFERTDRTFFEEVIPVLPGTFIEVDVPSLKLSSAVSFWEPKIIPSIKDPQEAAERFGKELDESVRIHLRSDVPVGCQLSGGLDSSSVFAIMQRHYTGDCIHSFTVQFQGFEKDETPFVNKMLEGSSAKAHFTTPDPHSFLDEIENFIWHHDEPVGSFAHYAGFVLARLIADHKIKVVLNGQGGDEVMGGYWQQYFSYLFSLGKRGRIGGLMAHIFGSLGSEGNGELVRQAPSMLTRYSSRNRKQPFRFTKMFEDVPSLHFFKDYFQLDENERRIFDIRNLILPRLLKWDDRNLMAFGVEGRYPFLDHQVIETALSFHTSLLFKKGWTKYPLRMAMKQQIPKEIYFRKSKWGFETPQQQWLQNGLKPMLSDWLKREKPIDQVLDPKATRSMADQFWETGRLEDAQSLLRLFLLDKWFSTFSIRI